MRKPPDEKMTPVEPWQLRAARAAADLSASDLAALSHLSVNSIRRVENGGWEKMSRVNQKALIEALQACGVQFVATEEGQAAITYCGRAEPKA